MISINEDDLVITAEAGVTWQQIWEALTPWRTASASLRDVFGEPRDRRGSVKRGVLMGTARAMAAPPTSWPVWKSLMALVASAFLMVSVAWCNQ